MDKIIFYSTHCPKCKVLEQKLKNKLIIYEEVNDVEFLIQQGIKNAPVLSVNGELLDFAHAIKWINER